jgi:hypothetical protein
MIIPKRPQRKTLVVIECAECGKRMILNASQVLKAKLDGKLCECGSKTCHLIDTIYEDLTNLSDLVKQDGATVNDFAAAYLEAHAPDKKLEN